MGSLKHKLMTNVNFKLLVNQCDHDHRGLAEIAHFWNAMAIHHSNTVNFEDIYSMVLKLQLFYSKQDFYNVFPNY